MIKKLADTQLPQDRGRRRTILDMARSENREAKPARRIEEHRGVVADLC
jgi:hypothetical protein